MKKHLKKIIPSNLLELKAKLKYDKNASPYRGMNAEEVFTSIYQNNNWGSDESVSGIGSTLKLADNLIQQLRPFLNQHGITSVLDLPCGDFNWMKKVDLSGISYIGADVVEELTTQNQNNFGAPNVSFQTLNLLTNSLPQVDLILVRDCFVHFSYEDIENAIDNIRKSGISYLLTTSFSKQKVNFDITTGDWRPINLERSPFSFPTPMDSIPESVPEGFTKEFKGKELSLWKVDTI